MSWRELAQSVRISGRELRDPDPSTWVRFWHKRISRTERIRARLEREWDEKLERLDAVGDVIAWLDARERQHVIP